MKIKSVRNLASGILLMFLAAACACKLLLDGFQLRFLLSALLAVSISLVSFYFAFTHRGIEEELSRYADERDRYLAIKSGHATVRIMNYLLLGRLLDSPCTVRLYQVRSRAVRCRHSVRRIDRHVHHYVGGESLL